MLKERKKHEESLWKKWINKSKLNENGIEK